MKNIKILVLLFISTFAFTSCDALLDDYETDFGKGPVLTQFLNQSITNNFVQDGTGIIYEYEVPIVYQGGDNTPLDEDVTITISVDADASTATEGVEFSLTETSFTIPAGSNTAMAKISVNSAKLDHLNPLTAVIQIDSSSQTVSENNKTIITLQGICPTDLAGDYTYSDGNETNATIVENSPGKYTVSRDNNFGTAYSFNFSDVCGKLTVTSTYITDNFSSYSDFEGSGTIDAAGTITFTYTIDPLLNNRTMTLVKD
ncbi:hypothetical protein [Polaribacter sp. NJDZ03]|uniref:hypothetical protein n=1 Tax=Polaribacter sp. NJDZ03 TaxID=2855841 RepID=UPI001C49D9DB|nr:hypothetical protein [Polaribacter sp. NJDZ03]